ncbi:sugar isomerase [Aureitalea sp. L0-47]|uniref:sugar isomerase n=1 Tax=Aureitalea sp. L0-47 TaxID=2816962 RepID=UPI002237504C|nr:sugar isomerase [Aureitalea sp. L0-47]MCW5518600.1 sugar isomerase [Aureitalea sp. L0-47]
MYSILRSIPRQLGPEQIFMLGGLFVNVGNYAYNLLLGRYLGPTQFADAALLVTLLLVLSFVAMTFQLTTAKFVVELSGESRDLFQKWMYRLSLSIGVIMGVVIMLFAAELHQLFRTESKAMFLIFGAAVPLYFAMSVNRGVHQGDCSFIQLTLTYQWEMISRLIITFLLLFIFGVKSSTGVAIGIALSMIAGVFPFKKLKRVVNQNLQTAGFQKKLVLRFLLVSSLYEGTLIICNNSDILLVKHYFESYQAGLYASLALIGRLVYYVTWMFVMLLLPKVVKARKAGEATRPLMLKYLKYIVLLCSLIVVFTFLFPTFSVNVLFGSEYVQIAPLLGWYAVATGLFAISNVFAYYFLSLDRYLPIILATIMGMIQVALIVIWHETLFEVLQMQVIAMFVLLVLQFLHFRIFSKSSD